MPAHANFRTLSAGDLVFAAYRQGWLAGLGAAAVARDWVRTDAAPTLRSLVKEGTVVESQAMRAVAALWIGVSPESSSYAFASTALRTARKQAAAAVGEVAAALPATIARLPLPAKLVALARPAAVKSAAVKPGKTARARKVAGKAAPKRPAKKAVRARKRA